MVMIKFKSLKLALITTTLLLPLMSESYAVRVSATLDCWNDEEMNPTVTITLPGKVKKQIQVTQALVGQRISIDENFKVETPGPIKVKMFSKSGGMQSGYCGEILSSDSNLEALKLVFTRLHYENSMFCNEGPWFGLKCMELALALRNDKTGEYVAHITKRVDQSSVSSSPGQSVQSDVSPSSGQGVQSNVLDPAFFQNIPRDNSLF